MFKIIVTGAGGFIGRNVKNALAENYETVNVDFFENLLDPFDFISNYENFVNRGDVIVHNGACSSTTATDPFLVNKLNFDYSVELLKKCIKNKNRLIYASSASVYGDGPFHEKAYKKAKNLYALSKSMFDDYSMQFIDYIPQVVGLRYFNVYGPHENKKEDMASVVYKFYNQVKNHNKIVLFKNSDKYLRDFVHVEDIIEITKFFIDNPTHNGIYNCGIGRENSFQDIADIFVEKYNCDVQYIDMPQKLIGKYQEFTRSDNNKIDKIYKSDRIDLRKGVLKYIEYLEKL
jgi:ADP-L-glycero-D-manno-heptose 6-epimerase